MTTESRLFNLGNIERFIFRPLFVFFTFVLVLLAVFQVSGRVSMQLLHRFESEINVVLGGWNISVQGLRGEWRGLNPVLRADALSFPAGSVAGLEVELDLLESALRSTPITRRLHVDDAVVHVDQTPAGWRLRNMAEQDASYDVEPLLRHGDSLQGRVALHLTGAAGAAAELVAEITLANRGGMHYAAVNVLNAGHADAQLAIKTWQSDAVWLVRDALNRADVSGALVLPQPLTGMRALKLEFGKTFWHDEDELGGGALDLTIDGVEVPATDGTLSARLAVSAERDEQQLRAMSSQLSIAAGDDELLLGPVYVDAELRPAAPSQLEAAAELLVRAEPKPLLNLWLAQLDLGQLSTFFVAHLDRWEPAASWVRSLGVIGQASNVHVYYDPEIGAGFLASIAALHMRGYKGAPSLANVQGRLWGYSHGMAVQINSSNVSIGFPDLFHDEWALDTVQGVVKAWFGNGYFGMQGSHLKARMARSNIGGAFAIARPGQAGEARLSVQVGVDELALMQGKTFVPFKIPAGLADWLERGPRAGDLADIQFALHGQTRLEPGELGRRIELKSKIANGRVEYDPAWPEVQEIAGDIHLAGVDTRINVASARSLDVQLASANIVLRDGSAYVMGNIETQTTAPAALRFVRLSPLRDTLSFIGEGWRGTGALNLRGNLLIPINVDEAPPLRVDLQFYLDGFGLNMPDYRIAVADLRGGGSFSLPHKLNGDFTGSLFAKPAKFRVHADDDWLRFDIGGVGSPGDVYELLATDYEVPVRGEFGFDSVLSLAMTGGVTNLSVDTNLAGLEVNLPGQFAKDAASAVASELDVQFLAAYQSVRWRYRDVNGWLHYGDGIERGALGIGTAPPMTAQEETAVLITGRMPRLVLSDWVSAQGESSVSLPLDWVIQGLAVERFVMDELTFEDLTLSGSQRGEDVSFQFDGPALQGALELPAAGVMAIKLQRLRLPDPDAGFDEHIGAPRQDPISVEVGAALPAADVSIAQLILGDEPFGAWRFQMRPQGRRVVFERFGADVNGVHIGDPGEAKPAVDNVVTWDLDRNTSAFRGLIKLDDLAQTLPQWDYAPSLSTSSASMSADVVWPGSPANVGLLDTDGRIDFTAQDGRFIEVEAGGGGLRILSLLNFTKVAKRINFDISDVVGEGMSFDRIDASVDLKRGQLTFPQRMVVDSSSGNFEVGGRVDLRSGQLDNEMIVTLPVSKSLPWYGVYLALANPLVGLGVVVGERMLRKPIEQFSTAKFAVTGTLDDPKVSFVSLFDRSMKDLGPDEATERATDAAEDVSVEAADPPTAQVAAPAGRVVDPAQVELSP